MSSANRLSEARAVLAGSVLASALLWATLAAMAVYAGMALARTGGYDFGTGRLAAIAGSAAITGFFLLWRGRYATSRPHVALWLEQRVPSLQYALVTLQEPQSLATARALESIVDGTQWTSPLRRATIRAIAPPLAGLIALAGIIVFSGLNESAEARRAAGVGGAIPGRATDPNALSRIASVRATIVPPSYSGERVRTLDDPSTIDAIVGSRIAIVGAGSAVGISAQIAEDHRSIESANRGWRLRLTMPARATALRLRDRSYERLLVLEPRLDSAPVVTLARPARDTVFRAPSGSIALAAEARDDFGVTSAWLEYIVSSGEGESFTFRSGVLGRVTFPAARSRSFGAALSLNSLGLKAGDVVHLRALARDNNNVSGPTTGYSETRAIRVARKGEYDSVAVEGAPPPENEGEVSQRMLIILTEALEKRRPRLERGTVISESQRISRDQARLRRRVGEIIFARLGGEISAEHSPEAEEGNQAPREKPMTPAELLAAAEAATGRGVGDPIDFHGDETPVVAVNRPLLEAFNAMWDAGRELDIGAPNRALPHMRAALAAIQRARAAERIYLRGRPPTVVIDLAKARLAARIDSVNARDRSPRPPLPEVSASRGGRLSRAVVLLSRDRQAALDSLLLLRLDAIGDAPAFARALGVAVDAIRRGNDATAALLHARRLATGEPDTRSGLPAWSGFP